MTLDSRFRARLLEERLQLALRQLQSAGGDQNYLVLALQDPDLASKLTSDLHYDRRLERLLFEDDEVDHWAEYVEHEQTRARSKWRSRFMQLPMRWRGWRASLAASAFGDPVVADVENGLTQSHLGELEAGERLELGLQAMRTALRSLFVKNGG